jgi:hypothetical protein
VHGLRLLFASVMVVSSEDRGKSEDRWNGYEDYEMQGRNQVSLERIRFRWKESGFVGRNQVSLEGIRFRWKESGFVGRNQVSLEGIRFRWLCCEYGMMMLR